MSTPSDGCSDPPMVGFGDDVVLVSSPCVPADVFGVDVVGFFFLLLFPS